MKRNGARYDRASKRAPFRFPARATPTGKREIATLLAYHAGTRRQLAVEVEITLEILRALPTVIIRLARLKYAKSWP